MSKTKGLLSLLVILLIAVLCAGCVTGDIQKADSALQYHDYDTAYKEAKAFLRKNPNNDIAQDILFKAAVGKMYMEIGTDGLTGTTVGGIETAFYPFERGLCMSAKLDSSILTNMRDDCYVTTWIRIFPDGDFTYQNDIYVGTSVAHESPDLPFLGDTDEITRNEYGDCYDLQADAELSDLIKRAEFQIIDYWFTYLADEYKITPEDLGFTSWYEEN